MKDWKFLFIVLSIVGTWILGGVGPLLYYKEVWKSGTFGDTFGAVNSLFTGLAFAGLLYTIYLQRLDLEIQRQELKRDQDDRIQDRVNSVRKSREQYLTARLNAATTLLHSYYLETEIGKDLHTYRKFLIPKQVEKLQRGIDLLRCEAELGFDYVGDRRTTQRISIVNYMMHLFSQLRYNMLLLEKDVNSTTHPNLVRDTINHTHHEIVMLSEEFRGLIYEHEATRLLHENALNLISDIQVATKFEDVASWNLPKKRGDVERFVDTEVAEYFRTINKTKLTSPE